jgi:hypothetical protein
MPATLRHVLPSKNEVSVIGDAPAEMGSDELYTCRAHFHRVGTRLFVAIKPIAIGPTMVIDAPMMLL